MIKFPKSFNSQITFLPSQNLDKTKRFYQDYLNLDLSRDQGDCLIFKVSETSYLGFCKRPVLNQSGKVILTLIAEDIEAWFTFLSNFDLDMSEEMLENTIYKITHFFVGDPDGYKIEIQRFNVPLN